MAKQVAKKENESEEEFEIRVIFAIYTLKSENITIVKHIYGAVLDNVVIPSDVTKRISTFKN